MCVYVNSYAFFTILKEIKEAAEFFSGQLSEITEEVFRKSMLAKTVESVNLIKKNYEDSMNFYRELKQLQENPYGILTDEDVKKFLSKYEQSKKIVEKVEEVAENYNKTKQSIDNLVNQYEKTKQLIVSDIKNVKKSLEQNIDYLRSNWEFVNTIVKDLNLQTSDTIKKLEKLQEINRLENNEKKKAEIEGIKMSLNLLQLQAQQQTNLLLIKLIEFQTQQAERQTLQTKQIIDKQHQFITSIKDKLSKQKGNNWRQ